MLKFENNRIYCGGFSVPIPNGLYLETDPEIIYEDGLFFYLEKKEAYIVLRFEAHAGSAEAHVKAEMEENRDVVFDEISHFVLNGLPGAGIVYRYTNSEHFEAWFDAAEEGSDIHLSIAAGVLNRKKQRAWDVFKRREVMDFISGIRKEKNENEK